MRLRTAIYVSVLRSIASYHSAQFARELFDEPSSSCGTEENSGGTLFPKPLG